jgi:hypothetical protein
LSLEETSMTAFYKRTQTLKVAKDSALTKLILSRSELATAVQQYDVATVLMGSSAAAAGSPVSVDMGDVGTASVLYLEYTGSAFDIVITDANGASTITLTSTVEGVFLLEGVGITAVSFQNRHATIVATWTLALFGAE